MSEELKSCSTCQGLHTSGFCGTCKEKNNYRSSERLHRKDLTAQLAEAKERVQKLEDVQKSLLSCVEQAEETVKEYDVIEAERDKYMAALEDIKVNSHPGLAVHEGTLLNRVYRKATAALTPAADETEKDGE